MWQIDQFVPLLAHGNYPNNGDVVLLSTVLPWHNDFLVRLPITFYLVTTAIAVFAVARELRAPLAASVLAGAVVVSLPVVGIATIPRALPDSLMWTTFACGVLFLLRHARTRPALGPRARRGRARDRGRDEVVRRQLGGGRGRDLGRRAPGARARRGAARGARLLRDAVLVGGLSFLGMLPWLARNLALSDNPVFPLKVAPFGLTIFDAPPDVIRDEVGFTIADYAGDSGVLWQLAGEIVEGSGIAPPLRPGARGRGRAGAPTRPGAGGRVLALAAGAIALGLLYIITPATALGVQGDPSLAHANTRYAVPRSSSRCRSPPGRPAPAAPRGPRCSRPR